MAVLSGILGTIIGVIAGWLIARHYYLKTSKDLDKFFRKLPHKIIRPILDDKRDHLTVKELNDLLEKKIIDPDTEDPLPYISCPKCGSTKLERSSAEDFNNHETHFSIKCPNCDWSDWTQ